MMAHTEGVTNRQDPFADQPLDGGIRESLISPDFLRSNASIHTWAFSAIAELIDNAYDAKATRLWIDRQYIAGHPCLVITDNGTAMAPDMLHRMLSFGYSDKRDVTANHNMPIGQYGNGFKSGTMRLGKDVVVFTKSKNTKSVGMLSQSYQEHIMSNTVKVPIVVCDMNGRYKAKYLPALEAVKKIAQFQSSKEVLEQFDSLSRLPTGTKIMIFNLMRGSQAKKELDFVSDDSDIINSEYLAMVDCVDQTDAIADPEHMHSLKAYLSILYMKPKMHLYLRGTRVRTRLVAKELLQAEKNVHGLRWLEPKQNVVATFGYTSGTSSEEDSGMMLYYRNRLIQGCLKVGRQHQGEALGVVGVVDIDFLQPNINKQDFMPSRNYSLFMDAMKTRLFSYWRSSNERKPSQELLAALTSERQRHWIQCDNCSKWRRVKSGSGSSLPDQWYCYMNTDPFFSRCGVEEDKEVKDERETKSPSLIKSKQMQKVESAPAEGRRPSVIGAVLLNNSKNQKLPLQEINCPDSSREPFEDTPCSDTKDGMPARRTVHVERKRDPDIREETTHRTNSEEKKRENAAKGETNKSTENPVEQSPTKNTSGVMKESSEGSGKSENKGDQQRDDGLTQSSSRREKRSASDHGTQSRKVMRTHSLADSRGSHNRATPPSDKADDTNGRHDRNSRRHRRSRTPYDREKSGSPQTGSNKRESPSCHLPTDQRVSNTVAVPGTAAQNEGEAETQSKASHIEMAAAKPNKPEPKPVGSTAAQQNSTTVSTESAGPHKRPGDQSTARSHVSIVQEESTTDQMKPQANPNESHAAEKPQKATEAQNESITGNFKATTAPIKSNVSAARHKATGDQNESTAVPSKSNESEANQNKSQAGQLKAISTPNEHSSSPSESSVSTADQNKPQVGQSEATTDQNKSAATPNKSSTPRADQNQSQAGQPKVSAIPNESATTPKASNISTNQNQPQAAPSQATAAQTKSALTPNKSTDQSKVTAVQSEPATSPNKSMETQGCPTADQTKSTPAQGKPIASTPKETTPPELKSPAQNEAKQVRDESTNQNETVESSGEVGPQTREEIERLRSQLGEARLSLTNLRGRVAELIVILFPHLDIGNPEDIEGVLIELLRVNKENNESVKTGEGPD